MQGALRGGRELGDAGDLPDVGKEQAGERHVEVLPREVRLEAIVVVPFQLHRAVEAPPGELHDVQVTRHEASSRLGVELHLLEPQLVDDGAVDGQIGASRGSLQRARQLDRSMQLSVDALEAVGEIGQ